jgi:hypothetical protein
MEFFTNMIRSCRMKRMKKELDRLPDEYLADLGVSRLGLLAGEPRLGTEMPSRSHHFSASKSAKGRQSSWEISLG